MVGNSLDPKILVLIALQENGQNMFIPCGVLVLARGGSLGEREPNPGQDDVPHCHADASRIEKV